MPLHHTIDSVTYGFRDLKDLLAKATPARAGDELAGIAAGSSVERVAAQMALPNSTSTQRSGAKAKGLVPCSASSSGHFSSGIQTTSGTTK